MDIPYLIPIDDIQQALKGNALPAKFRAKGTYAPGLGLFPAFGVKLAPGEAVVVPGGRQSREQRGRDPGCR